MQVKYIQQLLSSLCPFLQGAGVSQKVLTDIERSSRALELFGEMTVESLAQFLSRASEYERTGIVPSQTVKAKAPVRSKVKKLPSAEGIATALERISMLYERARSPNFAVNELEELMSWLRESLARNDLLQVAKGFELQLGSRSSIEVIIQAIRQRILSRKENAINIGF